MVIGDKRKYLIALFTLNEEEVISFAVKENIEFEEFEELAVRKDVFELIENGIIIKLGKNEFSEKINS